MKALVRSVASSFAQAITMSSPAAPISAAAAQGQHHAYVSLLSNILGASKVLLLPADDRHPDCCFVEDTALVVGRTAIIGRIGAAVRQGEEAAVATALQEHMGCTVQPPGLLDGGDVLQLPGSRHILVGLSRRTNEAAFQQLQHLLPQHSVHAVPVEHGLHLKSACTALDSRTMLYADDEAGRALKRILQDHPAFSTTGSSGSSSGGSSGGPWQHLLVEPECSNVLLLGAHVVMRGGFPQSERVLQGLARERGLQLHKLEFGEFAKADGSLTCCSILLQPPGLAD